jgi:hypothetical protein
VDALALTTVTLTGSLVAVLPAKSLATARRVWPPVVAFAVFHETE